MKYVDLKAVDGSLIRTSRIAMGSTMSMERLGEEEKFQLYDHFIARGGNCLDTARAYHDGEAEKMVGRYLKSRGNRKDVVLCTKGGHPSGDAPEVSRVNRKAILEDMETSLNVLGTDYVDVYWIHKDDRSTPIEELVDTANEIVRAGRARVIGLSNFDIDRFEAAEKYAEKSGQHPFSASQIQWSLASSEDKYFKKFDSLTMTKERYAYYLEHQITVFSFSSQAQGFFSKMAAGGLESLPPFLMEQFGSDDNRKRFERVKKYAQEHHCSISAPCLGYLLGNRLPCIALIGAVSTDMLDQSLEAADLSMTPEEADELFFV